MNPVASKEHEAIVPMKKTEYPFQTSFEPAMNKKKLCGLY